MEMQRTLGHHLRNPSANNFNLLRLIAATAVIFGHSFALSLNGKNDVEPIQGLLKFTYSGSIAVDVFFLISGIFVSQSLFQQRSYSSFVVKRFMRIWPGLVVCLAVTATMAIAITPGMRGELVRDPSTYLYVLRNSILDIQWNLGNVFQGRAYTTLNGSLWTLPLEVKMYVLVLVFGILGILYRKFFLFSFVVILAGLLIGFPEAFLSFFNATDAESLVPVIFFLAGMATFAFREIVAVRPIHLLCIFVIAWFTQGRAFEIMVYILIAMTSIWFGCSSLIARLPKLSGDYSYGVYIYGFPIQQGVATFWPGATPQQMFLAATAVTLLFAAASWHLVELPAQASGKTIGRILRGLETRAGWTQLIDNSYSGLRRAAVGIASPASATIIALIGLGLASARLDSIPPAPLDVEIVAFGPTPVTHSQPFNVQPNGESAIWVKLSKPADANFVLVLGDERLPTNISGDLLTAVVPPGLFANPGSPALVIESVQKAQRHLSKPVAFPVQ